MPSTAPIDLHTDHDSSASAALDRVRASVLDTDNARVEVWTGTLLAALAKVIRDDDTLVDAIVRLRNLHPEVTSLIASAAGWKPKKAAAWTTISNITLSGLDVQAGGEWTETMPDGTRVMVKDQPAQADNGIYLASAGPWLRADDADAADELGLAFVAVENGAEYGGTTWVVTSVADEITVGTTSIVWAFVGGTGGGGGGGDANLPDPNADDLLGWDGGSLTNVPRATVAAGDMVADWISDPFTGDGAVPSFILRRAPGSVDNLDVSIDGVVQRPGEQYTLSGQTITFLTPPSNGTKILVRYGSAVAQGSTSYIQEVRAASGGETLIVLATGAYIPGANTLAVYVNGLRLNPGLDFVETSSTSFTLSSALVGGDDMLIVFGQDYNGNAIGSDQIATGAVITSKILDGAVTVAKLEPAVQASLASATIPTGIMAPCVRKTAPTSWLLMNGQTIGSASSGATSRANADTQALFEWLWTEHDNADLTIQDSLGAPTIRGASAAADYTANKRMPIPDMRGEFARGWDDARGVDSGRAFGSLQLGALQSHTHTVVAVVDESSGTSNIGDSGSASAFNRTITSSATGGTETRPRNRAYSWIIKL